MQPADGLLNNSELFSGLAAYGEYSEEVITQTADKRSSSKKAFTPVNHLAGEPSPYLQLHALNPVGWFAWGREAFSTARTEDMPLFVSIGYSSNHWCHVMERDCFSNPEVAGFINEACIPVCVDREERPDLDELFTEICRVQNGSAGYPLNIFMTPEGRPFFCTTWLPKRTTGLMPGITELLPRIKWLWHMQRDFIERTASELALSINSRLETLSCEKLRGGKIGSFSAWEALNDLRSIFDLRWGGFGSTPKFPEPAKLAFLMLQARESSQASKHDKLDALTMTDITLRRMWRGGIHDHLGGGFSRYAIDEHWLVPHFEKLLCDQAMLLLAVSLAQENNQNSFHRLFAEDIIFCSARDFCDNASYSQGFRASIDGDTPDGEGRYYLWTEDEVRQALSDEDFHLFCGAYAVLPGGNFSSEVAGAQIGMNILYEASTVKELAKRFGLKPQEIGSRLSVARKLLLDARDKRYPLRSDNKILMNWNGLMIGALSRASVSFDQPEWRDMAERTALFLQKNLPDKSGNWRRRWIDGKADIPAVAEDYAYFLWGIVELYKSLKHFNAGEKQLTEWLNAAKSLADTMLTKCLDEKHGSLILTSQDDANIFARLKSPEDMNSLPNPNAMAAIALSELGIISEEKKYSDCARRIISCFARYVRDNPVACLSMVAADSIWKPVRKKPEPPAKPVLTDEELNRPEEPVSEPEVQAEPEEQKHPARAHRTSGTSRAERVERRRAGRATRARERH
ncbi:MAG: thioredoxin domain-containing protein [Synergistaceae bacterium]|nr:thioredoxin domain-containing protein [Synergistaceae bacterium]